MPHYYQFSQPQMGTHFTFYFYSTLDSSQAKEVAQKAFDRIAELNQALSDYLPESELNLLCKQAGSGQFIPVSKDLWQVLVASLEASELSEGAFDVSAGPLIRLWRRTRYKKQLPDSLRLSQAFEKVGYQKIELDEASRSVKLTQPDMRLDFGGIAKGYTADQVIRVFKQHQIEAVLVDAGGDLTIAAAPPGKKGWEVTYDDLKEGSKTQQVLLLSHCAVATSGDLYQHVIIDGKKYSHIVNPFTGIGLTNQVTVTVVAPTGVQADWLASTISILESKTLPHTIEKIPDTHFLILKNTEDILTRQAKGLFEKVKN
ncbi:FAD:protein FMN transferase [Rapidithrix thailandica]|uniref:FAD:protein FMN transferase n=1 Tax=Rapidithrix thailandica TaxID=413964 RepID=A0AAW9SAE7_9BACT